MEEIIEKFSNDNNILNSSYTISSEYNNFSHTSVYSENLKIKPINKKRNDEFIFDDDINYNIKDISSDIESITQENSFFNVSDLKKKKDIIKLFNIFDTVIFTDNIRIISKNICFFWGGKKNYIDFSKFPGILFIAFETVNVIKKIINIHNSHILDTDSETNKIKYKCQICFDDGDIFKNIVYKKIQIQNKLLFVPMNKYQLKITEYRLRGFCQIMEELGAVEIEIEFNNSEILNSKKDIVIKTEDYNYIAGSLGFSSSDSNSEDNKIKYKLIYPKNNTFILNSKVIKKKIQTGKYIINKKNFDSSLELQYIIESRCRHFITNYSTVFTLDNSILYDHKLISNLKAYNFNLGFETNYDKIKNLKLSINTKVKFIEQQDSYINLLGDNVSWDSIGFNYLLGSLQKNTFNTEGILKIIAFVHKYIDKVLFYKNKNYFFIIKQLYKIINKEFSFDEYKTLLLSYFSINSHWLHFLNFINVLVFKSVSYDKLGFLILMNQTDIPVYKKNIKILNFIKHLCTNQLIEDNFWEMMAPNNYYLSTLKLEKYDLLKKFNWFNLERLLYDIKKYKSKKEINTELNYTELYNNFILGHTDLQFEKNIKPFLVNLIRTHFKEKINNSSNLFINHIYNIIYSRHLFFYNLNTENKLIDFINSKIENLNEANEFYQDIYDVIKEYKMNDLIDENNIIYNNILLIIQDTHFTDKYPYVSKKILSIIDNINKYNIYKFCIKSNIYKNIETFCKNIINKIILFDNKADINNIELSNYGYKILMQTLWILPDEKEIKILYFKKLCTFIINQKLTEYIDHNIVLDNDIITLILKCNNFNKLVDIACTFLNDKVNLNLDNEFCILLKN